MPSTHQHSNNAVLFGQVFCLCHMAGFGGRGRHKSLRFKAPCSVHGTALLTVSSSPYFLHHCSDAACSATASPGYARLRPATPARTRMNHTTTGVKERHLETVLPARGGKVIVVRGAEKGVTGKLLAKNKEKETALVQVSERATFGSGTWRGARLLEGGGWGSGGRALIFSWWLALALRAWRVEPHRRSFAFFVCFFSPRTAVPIRRQCAQRLVVSSLRR